MGPRKTRPSCWARRRDERGATLVLTAICMVLLLWGGAMGVDIGFTVVGSRQAQALADTGALDMARYINLADNATKANYASYMSTKLAGMQSDNNAGGVTFTATGMYWSSTTGWTIPANGCYQQFPPRTIPCTAVLVTAKQSVPRIFSGGNGSVTRSAIAAVTPEDGFSIGTYLASLDSQQSGVLNALLNTIGTVDLTAAGYEGLANSYVTVQQLITASGGVLTPSNVLTQNISAAQLSDWLTIALGTQQAAVNCATTPEPSVCTAYSALGSASFGSTTSKLCQLVAIDQTPVNEPNCPNNGNLSQAGLSTSLDVLQTLTTEAELTNGTNALNVQSALGITGLTGATLSLQLIQPPEVAYGPVGTTATTAQVSADLQLNLGPANGGTLSIPVTGAAGTATLTSMTCSEQNNSYGSSGITASTTTATDVMTLGTSQIGTLSLSGAPSADWAFGATVIPPTASTFANDTNPISIGTTSPTLSISGYTGSGLASLLLTGTSPILYGVLGPVLQAAGVAVGGAAIADLNYNCGAVSIVK
jgi:uncharacterized membrane protein